MWLPVTPEQIDLFADFNGLPDDSAKTEFYQHDAHWANRMILGDSLQVMASLAEREGLRGQAAPWGLVPDIANDDLPSPNLTLEQLCDSIRTEIWR